MSTRLASNQVEGLFINTADYEADPTGVTDSSPMINAALADSLASPLSLHGKVFIPTGVYQLDSSLDLFSDLVLECAPHVVFNCGAAFFDKQNGSPGLARLKITGNPLIRSDNTYTGVLFRTDSMSYLDITARFDGRGVTTASLFSLENMFAGTDAYNKIRCEFKNCLNSVTGAVFIEGGTFHDFTGSSWNSNGKNFTLNGKGHMFGHGTAIESSTTAGSEIFSPLTTLEQCWVESDEITFKSTAYGASVIDCRTRGGSLDGTDYHLNNWIKDETIVANFFKKNSPYLNYREGHRQLRVLWPTNATGKTTLDVNSGGEVSYGIHPPLNIVGYVVDVISGGSVADMTMNIGINTSYNPASPSFFPLTSFELSGSDTSSGSKYVQTWSDTPSVFYTMNPSTYATMEVMARWNADEVDNFSVVVGILVV